MSEKDRFGEKLKDKERAEEDRFFADRDRQLLEKLRDENQHARSEADRAAAPRGRCPKCGTALDERSLDGVVIDECSSCHGVWLDSGELEALSKRERGGWVTQLFRRSLVNTR